MPIQSLLTFLGLEVPNGCWKLGNYKTNYFVLVPRLWHENEEELDPSTGSG
jgi:hypothetical protein